ncbi:MAG: amino acid ABC transporter substrate-binding protein, partial [Deltaproteobacteria bacterium]|nr:amino acid ABC transporter substrate-binding protein [Deltaproteobacteria bacterium]MBW2650827.1 amino acid ABC transporter substrate-binding protein [Deltaproteobacteria bacterium]
MQKRVWKSVLVLAVVLMIVPCICFAGTTYDKVKDAGVVKAGLMYNSIPAAYFNDKNEWVGFDVDIASEVVKRIGQSMGKELKME